jgi:anti-sigma B factor antagonist
MFEVQTKAAGDQRTVVVQGEVDLEVSPELWNAMESALSGTAGLRVDLSAVSYIDSSGIAMLVKGLKHARKQEVSFALLDPSEAVLQVMELAQLHKLFVIETST